MGLLKNARRAIAIAAAIGTMGLAPAAPAAAAGPSLEYAVKAAYLSKFGIFVDWPKSVLGAPDSAVVLCVAGDDPFGDTLDKVADGQRIGTHPLTVRRLKAVTRDSGCDIVYIAGSNEQSVDQALDAVNGAGVLTVTDSAHDAHGPGIVEFVVQNNRVRFNIDDDAAARNGITISSHLLSLALSVRHRN